MAELPLPADVDCERLVLGLVLRDEALMANCRPVLSAEDFSIEFHRRVWKHACKQFDNGNRADTVTVACAMKDAGESQHDTLSRIVSLEDGLPQFPSVDAYVKRLLDESMRRRVILLADSMHKRAVSKEDPRAILESIAAEAINKSAGEDTRGLISARELVDKVGISQILAPRIEHGISFPWKWMTQTTCGMLPGELWVLAAHTSCGKSSAAIQTGVRVAQKGRRVAIFSLEMGPESLFNRATYQLSGVDSEKGKRGLLNHQERVARDEAAAALYELPILFSQKASFTALEIYAELRREKIRGPIGLVIVDYLQLLSDGGRHDNRAQAVGAAARACKLMAGEFECPVILLSQFSRESNKPGKQRRPELTDLKESGDIENHANGVWFLHRESMVDEDMVTVEFILAKQRDGRRNVKKEFWFQPKLQRFDAKENFDD